MSTQSTTPYPKIIHPQEALKLLNDITENSNILTFIRYNHKLEQSFFEGLQQDEIQQLVNECDDSTLKTMYTQVLSTVNDNGESTLLTCTDNDLSSAKTKSHVMYAEKRNDEYYILTVDVQQTKELDWNKIAAVGGTGAVSGATFGTWIGNWCGAGVSSIVGPVGTATGAAVGCLVGGTFGGAAVVTGVARKAYQDYRKEMPKAVYGYIFKELEERQLLLIRDNKFALQYSSNEMA